MRNSGGEGSDGEVRGGQIRVHVRDIHQLFHTLDPSPFYDRDLDDKAEEFIIGSAEEVARDAPLTLIIVLDQTPSPADRQHIVDAVRVHFGRRADVSRRKLRLLFKRGRVSLGIGIPILATMIVAGELASQQTSLPALATALRESLIIGGWVAMWRPMEIFLYDWWPIRDERRRFERLATMRVRIMTSPGG
jgi:hypothetical protein